MIKIHYSADDLAKLRFAYRPLLEIPLSYRVLINPTFQSLYLDWIGEARRALNDLELPYMHALIPPAGYIPDFVTAPPHTNRYQLEADLDDLLATPAAVIQQDIMELIAIHGDSELRRQFLAYPQEALQCLIDEMRLYWQRVLKHYWLRMVSTLDGDILYHARFLALHGPNKLLEELHPSISIHDGQIDIQPICACLHEDFHANLEGRGVQLVPLIFQGCGRMYQITPHWQPMIAYGVRGTGLWYRKTMPSNQALELALGSGRASVLLALVTPRSNGELARLLHITTGAVSQHITRLNKAGLVESHRVGRRSYYRLTSRGEDLIRLFEPIAQ